jgi:hypothetical protein
MFDDLITHRPPPPNGVGKCDGEHEEHLPEGAIMVPFAMHLLRTVPGLREVSIHPDGEHGKRFDCQGWLGKCGFMMKAAAGTTSMVGPTPRRTDKQSLSIRGPVAATSSRSAVG